MQQLSCAIVDDEPKALKLLELMIMELSLPVEIKGVYSNPKKALTEIPLINPDCVFMDIDMPELSGFDLIAQLNNQDLHVVFVTGYDHYALDAIKISAIDYLVKPIGIEELESAIKKVIKKVELASYSKQNKILFENLQKPSIHNRTIGIPSVDGIDFIPVSELLYLEASDRYTKVISEGRNEILSSYNIGQFNKILGSSFYQCHRSYLVNMNKVVKYHKEGFIILSDGCNIPLARRRKDEFLMIMQDRLPNREGKF